MTDFIQIILTGFFTGVGVGFANWIHDKKIRKLLEKGEEDTANLKNKIKEYIG